MLSPMMSTRGCSAIVIDLARFASDRSSLAAGNCHPFDIASDTARPRRISPFPTRASPLTLDVGAAARFERNLN